MTPSVVYVVIVTYNGLQWTDRCLSSLRKSNHPVKTIIIDNGSTDGSLDIIKSKYPEIDLIIPGKNLGFGQGNNVGIQKAFDQGADFVFLLNQDAWIEPDTLSKLIAVSDNDDSFGILSPVHLQSDNKNLDKQFSNYVSPPKCRFYNDLYAGSLQEVYETTFVNAAGWLMTRKCISATGLFEPLFFIYGEDENFIQRIKFHGFRIGVVPAAKMVHDRGERPSKKNEQGLKIEVQTYLYVRLLNVHNGTWRSIFNAIKVFSKYGVNGRSITNLLSAMPLVFRISGIKNKQKKKGYLLK
jgi:GT2 family glycosyltransferase